jgi:hypothetical protein
MRSDRISGSRRLLIGVIAAGVIASAAIFVSMNSTSGNRAAAESPSPATRDNPLREPANGKSDVKQATATASSNAPASRASGAEQAPAAAPPGEHPIDAALEIARRVQKHIADDIKDYTCVFIKEERVNGDLIGPQYIDAKFRQKPQSAYFKFLKPDDVKGREVVYVAGENGGKLSAREGSGVKRLFGMVQLEPTSALAMAGQRYPINNSGIAFLTKRLIEVAEQDRKYGEIEVHFYKDAKVGDRSCLLIEVIHPVPRRVFLFHRAVIYIDDELQVPIHYKAYLWPKKPGDDPPLDESYTYANLKLNVGLTDADFDSKNPKYGFVDK